MFGFKLLARLFNCEDRVVPGVMLEATHKEPTEHPAMKFKIDEELSNEEVERKYKTLVTDDVWNGANKTFANILGYRFPQDLRNPVPLHSLVEEDGIRFNTRTPYMLFTIGFKTPLFYLVNRNKYFMLKPLFRKVLPNLWCCMHEGLKGMRISATGATPELAYEDFIYVLVQSSNGNIIHVNPFLKKHHEQM